MSASDIATMLGYLVAAWCVGFAGGYTITKYRDALNQVG